MKNILELVTEQKNEVLQMKSLIETIVSEKIKPNIKIKGAFLTGSVARGDARIGPFGVMIDLSLIVENINDIKLENIFGKDEEPFIPYHCITLKEKIGLAIELIEEKNLWKIREMTESTIFAKNESIILDDKTGTLKIWKDEFFDITDDQIKERALTNYFRFCYLTDEYHFEKWAYRKAFIQINQNFNEASECYCNFLYCINKQFIPRKDWLTYLTYQIRIKPEKHDFYMNRLYTSQLDEKYIIQKNVIIQEIHNWMEKYCKDMQWL